MSLIPLGIFNVAALSHASVPRSFHFHVNSSPTKAKMYIIGAACRVQLSLSNTKSS